jgi:hypothetical protein
MEQFAAPSPEAVQQAERQMLAIFKHGLKRKEQDG